MADETTPTTADDTADTADRRRSQPPRPPEEPVKLHQQVEIKDVGPCKKHVKVTVDARADRRAGSTRSSPSSVQSDQPQVRGFRPGKAPRKIIEKQYHEEVAEEVKTAGADGQPRAAGRGAGDRPAQPAGPRPDADRDPRGGAVRLRVRHRGPARVRPARLQGPEAPPADPHVHRRRGRGREAAAPGAATASSCRRSRRSVALDDLRHRRRGHHRSTARRSTSSRRCGSRSSSSWPSPTASPRTSARRWPGPSRATPATVDITLSQERRRPSRCAGQKVQADVRRQGRQDGPAAGADPRVARTSSASSTPEQFDELVRVRLERRLEYTQRQAARQQVLEQLAGDANWDLPQDLLRRQARKTLHRRVMEMQQRRHDRRADRRPPAAAGAGRRSGAPPRRSRSTSSSRRSPRSRRSRSRTTTSTPRSSGSPTRPARAPARSGPGWRRKT